MDKIIEKAKELVSELEAMAAVFIEAQEATPEVPAEATPGDASQGVPEAPAE